MGLFDCFFSSSICFIIDVDTPKHPLLTGRQGKGNVSNPKLPLCIRMPLTNAFEFVESRPYKVYPFTKRKLNMGRRLPTFYLPRLE